jgi:hypothetical protein
METIFSGKFTTPQFKEAFVQEVDVLVKQDLTPDFKNKLIYALTETYWEETQRLPDSYELERLTTWLVEDKSRDPDKVTNTEYPILSDSQMKLRKRRELASEHLAEQSISSKHKINGKKKPKAFRTFGDYEGV